MWGRARRERGAVAGECGEAGGSWQGSGQQLPNRCPTPAPLPYTRSPRLFSAGSSTTACVALSELAAAAKASTLPPPDAKATYSEVMATVGTFRTENMWYLAHPETGKKVTQQGVSVGRV